LKLVLKLNGLIILLWSNQLFELSGINKSEIYNKFYFQVIQEND
jgi:hypothetical protein